MKKAIILAFVLFSGFTAFAQSYTLKNGGFENGNLIKGTKNAVEGNDWFWQVDKSKVAVGSIELSNETKNQGKTSLKITVAPCEILARYNVSIAKGLGLVPKIKYTLSFWAKSNIDVQLNVFFNGSALKDGVSTASLTPGDVIKVIGTNKWEKYTVKLTGKMFSGLVWDLTQPTGFNLGLQKQTISEDLVLYIDDLELLD
jgi:hypothetical protein